MDPELAKLLTAWVLLTDRHVDQLRAENAELRARLDAFEVWLWGRTPGPTPAPTSDLDD